jgi:methionyl-tRNA formyltransferase
MQVIYQGWPAIRTVDGLFIIRILQPAGKKAMPGKVFLQGVKDWQPNAEL